jgi:hypothetical protein
MLSFADNASLIMSRIVNPGAPALSESGAREILALSFPVQDRVRIDELAEKARAGSLTEAEHEECLNYEHIGHFLSLLHSKARLTLKRAAN